MKAFIVLCFLLFACKEIETFTVKYDKAVVLKIVHTVDDTTNIAKIKAIGYEGFYYMRVNSTVSKGDTLYARHNIDYTDHHWWQ